MPTIHDVALSAKVSISTVSHVINGTRYVDPEKVERVREAIRVLGYQPNSVARSLRHGKTNMLALIVPDNSNPYFAELARAIEDAGFAEGFGVILCNSDVSKEREESYVYSLLSKKIDGFIFIPSSDHSAKLLQTICEADVPVVIVDRKVADRSIDHVLTDNEQGGYLAGRYLLQLGHRHIGCIVGPENVTLSRDRLTGFRQALAEAQIELIDTHIVHSDFRATGGQVAMSELLRRDLQLTAVFAANDMVAMGALHTLRREHIRVPEDISVIGFDNIMFSSVFSPGLTTIAQPIKEIGQQSVALLLKRIKQRSLEPSYVILPTTLVERDSCCAIV
jgi:LacI family transcriptional regulator